MKNKSGKAKGFLAGLLDDDSDLAKEIEQANQVPEQPETQFIVYYIGEEPDTVWEYNHKPDDGIPYGRLYGYWDEDKEKKEARHFVEHKSNNLKLMDFDTFMDNVPPNRNCTKVFDSEADFLLDLI